jgi:transcriptional regulator with XRE-family HTH domain
MKPMVVFGATIRKLRLRQGLSQYDLADLSGLHRNYISGIELGRRNLGLENIVVLAAALKVKPSALFKDF